MGGFLARLIVTYAYICFSRSSTTTYVITSLPLECSPTVILILPIASVYYLMPVYYPCTIARLVSCYALFK